eukprot:TRINITY_DN7576_c0_g1_i3.p1 TRINITY_DN7576_c0_g1~~TRINITY_DN7576_c0_g1_i3.p1  ORF type:complete len:390 (+),score=64.56 TRINITY_DN7576_c0_g1_i3:421-1590(+)
MRLVVAAFAVPALLTAASESAAGADNLASTAIGVKPGSFSVLLNLPSHAGGSQATSVHIAATIDALTAIKGVEVKESLPEVGLLYVSAPHNSAARIRQTAGVKAVAPTLIFSTPSVGTTGTVQRDLITDSDAAFIGAKGVARHHGEVRKLSVSQEPNFRSLQWGRTAIDADRAFKAGVRGGGKRPARVAILDTGFWLDHPSIKHYNKTLSFNFAPGETLNFNLKLDPSGSDFSHGTHTSSLMGGADLGGSGTLGVAPEAELILLKVLSERGFGDDWGIISAIKYAADNGVDILSLSLGGVLDRRGVKIDDPTTYFDDRYTAEDAAAIIEVYSSITKYAAERDATLIVAAGNDAAKMDAEALPLQNLCGCPARHRRLRHGPDLLRQEPQD